jgi:small subunit ribosomal protein S16
MVTIRLSRAGTVKRPFYHIVATDHRNRRDGRYLERLGYFNPIASGQETELKIDLARVDHWVARGARLSARVAALVEAQRSTQALPANEVA